MSSMCRYSAHSHEVTSFNDASARGIHADGSAHQVPQDSGVVDNDGVYVKSEGVNTRVGGNSASNTGASFGAFSPEDMYGAPVGDNQEQGEKSFSQKLKGLPKLFLVKCIRFYQKGISPLFPPTCRYVPSCSQYAIIAIQRYGFVKGGWLATKRVLRCHPWHAGGYDPVP